MVTGPARWFSEEPNLSPFLTALHDVRRMCTQQGWCRAHAEAIMVAIDQYAEAATGNREYFLNKPGMIPTGRRNSDVP